MGTSPSRRFKRGGAARTDAAIPKSRTHEWINTVIAVAAFIAAGGSALFAWQANQLHKEDIVLELRHRNLCKMHYELNSVPPYMEFCWDLLISNRSEDKATVTDIVGFDEENIWDFAKVPGGAVDLPRTHVDTVDGVEIANVVPLDGGEAKSVVAHVAVALDKNQVTLLRDIEENRQGDTTIEDLTDRIITHSLKLEPKRTKFDLCKPLGESDDKGECRRHFTIQVKTARGSLIEITTTMPHM